MAITKSQTDLVVIGAGPGGYAAAFRAADLGLKVALVEVEANPGGVCLYRGCIPSKALLHLAKVISESQEVRDMGLTFAPPKIDVAKIQEWKNSVVQKLTGGLGGLTKQRKINYIQGRASFIDNKTLKILKDPVGEEHLSFKNAIIATGSRPISLFDDKVDSPHLLNSTKALSLDEIPKTMLVVGGGYIGLELGQVYATFGCDVTVVEMTAGFLPGADRDLVKSLEKRLTSLFSECLFETKVTGIKEAKKGLEVAFESGDKSFNKTFDKVLVSVGRKPNSTGLALDNTKVQINARGFIEVNASRQTAEKNIYAIGDVVGDPMLAHKASHEGFVAVEAIMGKNVVFEPMAIPAVVFTDPEIAWCGLTEEEAKKANKKVEVVRFPWAASGRALTLGRTEGLTKLIIDPETEMILGMGLCGPGAGDMIAEGVLAMEMGVTASDLKLTIHPHPTLSETIMEAAEVFFGESTHLYRPKKK